VCFFGEGTSNRGTFHEAANAAALWKLPVIWLCENNSYAVSVPATESTSVENIADRAVGYGIPGIVIDGQDVVAVYDAVSKAVNRARSGGGPTLIEAKTYRLRGHFEGDPEAYRTKEEIEEWRKRDPLIRLEERLTGEGATDQDLEAVRQKVQHDVDEAAEVALAAPMPERERLFEGVYA
jgi:pyruvate dehydrogenase E1 component alpha subunit